MLNITMLLGYDYTNKKGGGNERKEPPSRVAMRRCNAERITQCSMSRATLEATVLHHWASICPVLLRRMPWTSICGLEIEL